MPHCLCDWPIGRQNFDPVVLAGKLPPIFDRRALHGLDAWLCGPTLALGSGHVWLPESNSKLEGLLLEEFSFEVIWGRWIHLIPLSPVTTTVLEHGGPINQNFIMVLKEWFWDGSRMVCAKVFPLDFFMPCTGDTILDLAALLASNFWSGFPSMRSCSSFVTLCLNLKDMSK